MAGVDASGALGLKIAFEVGNALPRGGEAFVRRVVARFHVVGIRLRGGEGDLGRLEVVPDFQEVGGQYGFDRASHVPFAARLQRDPRPEPFHLPAAGLGGPLAGAGRASCPRHVTYGAMPDKRIGVRYDNRAVRLQQIVLAHARQLAKVVGVGHSTSLPSSQPCRC
jgi:hypothetical protein